MPHKYFAQLGKKNIALNAHCSINTKGELLIYGDVGDWWESLDAKTIVSEIEALEGGVIVVRINSDGGNVMEGLAMYHALRSSNKKVITHIDGIAASMGGALFLAGEERHIPANGFFHLHKVNTGAYAVGGNANDLRDAAEQLESIERGYVNILAQRSGQTVEQIEDILADGKDHFYIGQEAVDAGFATALFDYEIPVAAKLHVGEKVQAALLQHKEKVSHTAAAAAQTQKAKKGSTMLFNVKSKKNGGTSAAVALLISAALVAEYTVADDAVKGLAVEGLTVDVLSGAQSADDELLKVVAGKLGVDWAEERPAAVPTQADAVRLASIAAEAKLDATVVKGWLDKNLSVEDASMDAIKQVAARKESGMPAGGGVRVVSSGSDLSAAMAQAMLVRSNPSVHEHTEASREFAYSSLMEMAKAYLSVKGERVNGISPNDVMAKAYSSASDFPLILADVGNKEMLSAYKKKSRSFTSIARRASVTDFKERHVLTMGAGSQLSKVGENGEYKTGKFSEAGNSYSLDSFGRIFKFGRRHMINDDLNSLTQFMQNVGSKAAALEQKIFWDLFKSTLKYNGSNLYAANNNTLVNAGATVEAALAKMKQAMRKQTDLDGEQLDLIGAILIVSAEREEEALKQLAAVAATKAADVNIHSNSLSLLAESRLDGVTNNPFYLLAPVDEAPVFEYAYLQGEENPRLETQYGFESDGMSLKIAHDFGAGCIGGRGIVKNSGVAS